MHEEKDTIERSRPLPEPGHITAISAQRHDPKRLSVFLDGVFAFGLYADLAVEYALEKGQFLSAERLQQLIDADRLIKAKFITLDYLAYKARTEKEVRDHLVSKGFAEHIAETVVARFMELGYLNDQSYARQFASSRSRNKGHGPRRIRQELRRKGVATEHIQQAIEHNAEQTSPYDTALPIAEKRWARLAKESNPMKRQKKLQDFLLRRGFDFDTIRQVIETLRR